MKKFTQAGLTGLTMVGLMLVGPAAWAVDPTPLAQPDYSGSVSNAATAGGAAFNANVLYALLIPALWVGYKVIRRVIAKVG